MIVFLGLTIAWAGDPIQSYRACCEAMGIGGCPVELDLRSAIAPPGSPGVWNLRCTGETRFLSDRTVQGQITAPGFPSLSTQAIACFNASCHLPSLLCLTDDGPIHCSTGKPAETRIFQSPIAQDSAAVVISGRLIPVRPMELQPPPIVASDLPPEPPEPCRANPEWRDRSNAEVAEGNEAVMQSNPSEAMARYRAAIGIDACNPFAWADLGDALMFMERPQDGLHALSIAVRLMPTHYQAWTHLGDLYERQGRADEALDAYQRAIAIRPGHPPAVEGLKRLSPY